MGTRPPYAHLGQLMDALDLPLIIPATTIPICPAGGHLVPG